MKNLLFVLITVFAVSCVTLKPAEQTIYVKIVKIKTIHGNIFNIKNAKVYRNIGRTEIKTIDAKYVFINSNIKHMSIDPVWCAY